MEIPPSGPVKNLVGSTRAYFKPCCSTGMQNDRRHILSAKLIITTLQHAYRGPIASEPQQKCRCP